MAPQVALASYGDPTRASEFVFNKIVVGDALSHLSAIKRADLFDVVIADPPYNIGKNFGACSDDMRLESYVAWSLRWLKECLRLLKPGKPLYVYGYGEILAHIAVHFPLTQQRQLIWHYTNKAVPSAKFWQRSHEVILCLWKGKRSAINIDDLRIPYTPSYVRCAGKTRKSMECRYNGKNRTTVYKAHPSGALPRDVLHYPALAGGAGRAERWFLCKTCDDVFAPQYLQDHQGHTILKHPTQKPIALSCQLIRSATHPGDSVLVPFCGSGTECVAARQLGVNYYSVELNEDYVRLAQERLSNVSSQQDRSFYVTNRH